ncbi:cilia- and flagella-associated protein 100 [Cephus cinctus]|uniref:Cilia- and flagella-associated protein 100 n=1 Tax=Cephus cinctus TaxID=211228 RepID=A0AAJ7RIB8_CEPCN|nr:cilia- and flagella-associated protein 100 [Cephus cinctus]XP_024940877.1 cilia- and flagella-associated protein 100 [Cephus cinctus]
MSDDSRPPSFSRVRQISRKVRPPVKLKKESIRPPTINEIIFHRRNVPRSRYYFTSGHEHCGKPRDVNTEQSPYAIPPNSSLFSYAQYCKGRKQRSFREPEKPTYKTGKSQETRGTCDILKRLQVQVEIEEDEAKVHKDMDKANAMTDIDPEYFTELRGRVIKDRSSLKKYVDDIREVLRTRLLAGQEKDDCIRIDQQFNEEQKRLDKIKRRYRQYVTGFEEFLSKDHEQSMEVLRKAEEQTNITDECSAKRNQLSKAYGQIRLDVYFWEEAWRMVKMCQKFLYQVSPLSWRIQHDLAHRNQNELVSAQDDDLFSRYKMADQVASLDSLIELFEQDIADAEPPQLYFEDPQDLLKVFRAMELQNLNALMHLESLAGPMAAIATTITEAENQIKSEIREIVEGIEDLEAAISWKESRAASLEEYANYLLYGIFRNLVCSEPVLNIRVFIEDTYESCVAPNDANLDSYTMMRSIEKVHEELNMQLDNLPHEVVQTCEKEGFRQEMKAMKEAEDAARKFELMHRLLAALQHIMEPPKPKKRSLVKRSAPIEPKIKEMPPAPPPTDEEMQILTFFTGYCPQENYENYRNQFPDDFDLTFRSRGYDLHENISQTDNKDCRIQHAINLPN